MLLFRILPLAILLTSAALAQNVRITFVGQACFYVQTEGGSTVVVDPTNVAGYTMPAMPADVVAISHPHGDHSNSAAVRGTFTLVDGRTTARSQMNASGMPFVVVPGFHDNTNGSQRGQNSIIQWTQGGLRFAHFGDYGQDALTDAQLADLRDLDVLMVPAGGTLTIGGQAVASVFDQLRPRIAILMHYRTGLGGPAQLAAHPAVTASFPLIRYKPAVVTISRATLPVGNEVWAMEPQSEAIVTPSAGSIPGKPLAPSGIASIFGTFTDSATAAYATVPLPRKLGETEVFIGTEALPLFYVSPGQVNFQVPARLTGGQDVVEVRVGGQRVARGVLTTVSSSPGLFLAVDQAGRLNRVRRGDYLTIYGSGQGVVTPAVADGAAPGLTPLSMTPALPIVLTGSSIARVAYSGMAPGYPGLWQINAQIATDAPLGPVDLVVAYVPNLPSNALRITVE